MMVACALGRQLRSRQAAHTSWVPLLLVQADLAERLAGILPQLNDEVCTYVLLSCFLGRLTRGSWQQQANLNLQMQIVAYLTNAVERRN